MALDSQLSEHFQSLKEQIVFHDRLYYQEASPEISDQAYDLLKSELEKLLNNHPELDKKGDPINLIGDDHSEAFERHPHKVPMLSLDNTYNKSEFINFVNRIEKHILGKTFKFSVEPKIDGVAISLTYLNGILTRALTRGNGNEGDDITRNVRLIKNLPMYLDPNGHPFPQLMEIRGEIYMRHDEFERINSSRLEDNLEAYKNPRNLAAGSIKILDLNEAKKRQLNIATYGIGAFEPSKCFKTQEMVQVKLKKWGFPVLEKFWIANNLEEAWKSIEQLDSMRNEFAYPTDGAVIKVDDFSHQKLLGSTSKAPRYAIAYKFESEQVETLLKNIQLQIGRTGVLTPVAILKPIQLAGTLVSRATLHNEDEILRKDIRIGDTVIVQKAGEIIPQILSVNLKKRPKNIKAFSFKEHLNYLGISAKRDSVALVWRITSENDPNQRKREILHYASKSAMDIENLGSAIIEQLISVFKIQDPSDLYRLTNVDFLKLEKFKEKSAYKLHAAIQSSKSKPLWRLIHGIGIPNVGKQSAKDLANHFRTLEQIRHASQEDLMQIEGIGETMAKSINIWFSKDKHLEMLNKFKRYGLNLEMPLETNTRGKVLRGKIFVITGKLSSMSREDASQKIENSGGIVSGSISKNTNYLLVGEAAGSKLLKAKTLGTNIISEEQFNKLLSDEYTI